MRVRMLLGEGRADVPAVQGTVGELGVLCGYPPAGSPGAAENDPLGVRSRDEAERELLAVRKALAAGGYSPPSKQPLARYLTGWLGTRTLLRPTTADTYAILVERYICNPDFGIGEVPLRALTPPLVRAFYTEVERRGAIRGGPGPLSPKSVHNVHLMLRKALEDATEDGLIPANAARRAHKLPTRRPEMKTWTGAELASFLAFTRADRLCALWRTAATTGMRRGELLGATWPALDLSARRLHVTQALSKGPRDEAPRFGAPKTDASRRAVPLDPETARILREHRRRQLEGQMREGPAYRDLQLVFCREAIRCLEREGPHSRLMHFLAKRH
jgi:integrase